MKNIINKSVLGNLLGLSLLSLLTTGCVNIPESLQVDEATQLTDFGKVRANATQYVGTQARWGGVIAKVENQADTTMLEVVRFELKASTRPTPKDETQGRFRIYHQGLLDPMIYKEGRSITALGTVAASEAGKIGEHDYLYPVLNSSSVHLWKKVKPVEMSVFFQPYWMTPSLWYYPRTYHPHIRYPLREKKPVVNTSKQTR
ncbi:Slp family lipoprotein [Thalassotalea sp. G2M2-11]|uniref:Slp family lipoprotein n=1 Tax=Thalassotalea sp. G2M2-11 TaxID=2787627 RepID=UPI0019CFBFA8|nr:Slp family lipoprotein [Thalassotalea sp. G2M2-11]